MWHRRASAPVAPGPELHIASAPRQGGAGLTQDCAQAFNWYSEAGIEVCLLSPHVDGYKSTPAAKVRTGAADVAIAPPETVISSHSPRESWAAPVKLKARPLQWGISVLS